LNLLSFGDEQEEVDRELARAAVPKRIVSSHDVLVDDPTLAKAPAAADEDKHAQQILKQVVC
jgi:hypothetical protein